METERENLLRELAEADAEIQATIHYVWNRDELPNCGIVSVEQVKKIMRETALGYEIESLKNWDYSVTAPIERLREDVADAKYLLDEYFRHRDGFPRPNVKHLLETSESYGTKE